MFVFCAYVVIPTNNNAMIVNVFFIFSNNCVCTFLVLKQRIVINVELFDKLFNVSHHDAESELECLACGEADVWQQHRVRCRQQRVVVLEWRFAVIDIECGAGDGSVFECRGEVVGVDETAACRVDYYSCFFHHSKFPGGNEAACLFVQGNVQ